MSESKQRPAADVAPPEGLPIDPTGVPNLDDVLGRGLLRGSLVIIVGPPGSGKTTMANQVAFAAAHAGRRAVVVTAISEPTSKLLAHLRTFLFYEDHLVGSAIQFLSLEQFLPAGLQATRDELIAIARQTRADLVVLDGFRGVRGTDVDPQSARQFLYDTGTTLSALGVTTIITSEADPRDSAFFPETTTGDVIIGLHYVLNGVLQQRAIEAIKVRGSEPLPGLHALDLGHAGTIVYPRLEARVAVRAEPRAPLSASELPLGDHPLPEDIAAEWAAAAHQALLAPFGIPPLDALLDGGLTRGTSTLMIGSMGTGKTLLALHFAAAGLRAGEPVAYLGFRESRQQLLAKARAFALGQVIHDGLLPGGQLTVQRWAPVELRPDIVADRLLASLDATGARRLVIDSVAELEHAILRGGDANRISDFLAALIEVLRAREVTALIIREHREAVATAIDLTSGPLSVMAENVLLMQQIDFDTTLHRVFSVVKMRFAMHDSGLYAFRIAAPDGIELLGPFADRSAQTHP